MEKRPLRLWVFGDAHVGTDQAFGRFSLQEAFGHSERGGDEGGPPFAWDIAVDVGDMSGAHHALPGDAEGQEVRRQFGVLRDHRREDVYSVCGNHDRSGPANLTPGGASGGTRPVNGPSTTTGISPRAPRTAPPTSTGPTGSRTPGRLGRKFEW